MLKFLQKHQEDLVNPLTGTSEAQWEGAAQVAADRGMLDTIKWFGRHRSPLGIQLDRVLEHLPRPARGTSLDEDLAPVRQYLRSAVGAAAAVF